MTTREPFSMTPVIDTVIGARRLPRSSGFELFMTEGTMPGSHLGGLVGQGKSPEDAVIGPPTAV
jgi:hypothetical protein